MGILIKAILIGLLMVNVAVAEQSRDASSDKGILKGKVFQKNKPMPRAIIALFSVSSDNPPDLGSTRRVPDGLVKVDEAGKFSVELFPGKYYLGAVSRSDDRRRMGPPSANEDFFFARKDDGKLRQFEIVGGQINDVGTLSGIMPEAFPEIEDYFTVNGTIFNEKGQPFPRAFILVRRELNVPRPLFISERTSAAGKYELKLPERVPYYLVVREDLVNVGRPRPGNYVGIYGGSPPSAGVVPTVFAGGEVVTGKKGGPLRELI
ncbi:MAG: hypothetical protein ABFS18_03685 [Thermodesulfobacteriota bacterium]